MTAVVTKSFVVGPRTKFLWVILTKKKKEYLPKVYLSLKAVWQQPSFSSNALTALHALSSQQQMALLIVIALQQMALQANKRLAAPDIP